ncbi:MAG: hypothetical protein AB7V27_06945 [Candidatus Binatia bacterium]
MDPSGEDRLRRPVLQRPHALAPFAAFVRERLFLLNQRRRVRRIARYHRPAQGMAALQAARGKTLIFTITAGRTGTTYLARLLALFPYTTSLHEPAPHFGYFLRQVQHAPELARRFWLEYKLPAIAAVSTPRYAEVSHLFCKGFVEAALDLGIVPRVVMLRRHPRRVALSWLTRGKIPGRTKLGLKIHVHPNDPGVLPLPNWSAASDYQLCFWYALEIERRQRAYAELLARAGGIAIDVTAEELHDSARFLRVAEALGLLDDEVDLPPLLTRHREISAVVHKPNTRAPATAAREEEAAVWDAVAGHAPWLRDDVEQRYGRDDLLATAGEKRGS